MSKRTDDDLSLRFWGKLDERLGLLVDAGMVKSTDLQYAAGLKDTEFRHLLAARGIERIRRADRSGTYWVSVDAARRLLDEIGDDTMTDETTTDTDAPTLIMVEPDRDRRRREMAATHDAALASRLDVSVAGGRYLTAAGQLVNADGAPIAEPVHESR